MAPATRIGTNAPVTTGVPSHATTRIVFPALRFVFPIPAFLIVAFALPARAQHVHKDHDSRITIPAGALYTEADVHFMQGMIAHHAQAIVMSRMAESHLANPRLIRFALKIDQGQMAEIHLMQDWLLRNGHVAPDTSSWRTMKMSGMLTEAQLARLDSARGPEFDRLFLEFMIQHHEGALQMVKELFATPRAGQDVDVNVFANDVVSVQTAEIGLMRQMLYQMSAR
jgi:uncharacterized protein (DUF305 family)